MSVENGIGWRKYLEPRVSEWLAEKCERDDRGRTTARDLYRAWAREHPHVSAQAFTAIVRELGYPYTRHATLGRIWLGLRLK